MNPNDPGPMVRMDRAALAAVGQIQRFYTWPTVSILLSFWAYLATLFVASLAPRILAAGGMRDLVVVGVPLLTLALHVCITHSIYRASDEYVRRRILQCAALAAVILAFATTGYFCLERLGYPHLSMIAVNLLGWSLFIVMMIWVRYRAR